MLEEMEISRADIGSAQRLHHDTINNVLKGIQGGTLVLKSCGRRQNYLRDVNYVMKNKAYYMRIKLRSPWIPTTNVICGQSWK